jgi:hypothetical protein
VEKTSNGGSQDASLEQIRAGRALQAIWQGSATGRTAPLAGQRKLPVSKALGYGIIRSPLLLGILHEIRKKETLFPENP